MTTSFQKKTKLKIGSIPGTRPSLYNNQLLVSSGIPSLDSLIGGGLAVGTLTLIEEDRFGSYGKLMLKYFCAEGIVNRQELFLSSLSETPEALISELPAPMEVLDRASKEKKASSFVKSEEGSGDEKMKIAWRYQNQPKHEGSSSQGVKFGNYFDLTKTMDKGLIESVPIHHSPLDTVSNEECQSSRLANKQYAKLLAEIDKTCKNGFETSKPGPNPNILRIGIHSLGSPLWGEGGGTGHSDSSMVQFLFTLRALLRTSLAAAVVTVPAHLITDPAYLSRVRRMADVVVGLDSFAGSEKEKNPAFREYHGLLHLRKLPRLNALNAARPQVDDFAFKLRRKKLTIETLHLPPELGEATSRSAEEDTSFKHSGGCRGSDKSKLSF